MQGRWQSIAKGILAGTAASRARAAALAAGQTIEPRLARMAPLLWASGIAAGGLWAGGTIGGWTALAIMLAALVLSAVAGGRATGNAPAPVPGEGLGPAARAGSVDEPVWRAIVDGLPDAALVLGDDLVVLHVNGSARELFPNLRRGRPVSHGTRHPELTAAIERAHAGEPAAAQLVETLPFERRLAAFVSRLSPAGQDSTRTPELLVVLRDLSEQDRLSQMRADFIANASHELRTPLASLRGFIETLQGPARNDAAARERFLTLMAAQAERMTRLIDDLLSLSRVEMRVHVQPRGVVDIGEAVTHVVQTLDPIARHSRTTVSVELPEGAVRVRGERDEIVQAVQNLVQNALKYGSAGGRIAITVGRLRGDGGGKERVAIAVSDDGPGIAREHLPRLTERFYRVNAASSRDKGGTGLGLAVVKQIVIRHRGELKIESTLGKGSTFAVILDVAADTPG